MKIMISNNEPCGLTEFYDMVAREIGCSDISKLKYDCTQINVAENIQDNFYKHYDKIARETEFEQDENEIKVGITMLLTHFGPKVDSALKANEVEVFDGFICKS